MKDREKIINFFKSSGEEAEEIAVRLVDLAESIEKGKPFSVGTFMSPYAVQIARTISAHMKTVTAKAWGGYNEAERVKIAFIDAAFQRNVDFSIALLKVTWDDRYRLIGHRDILGSLMGLGIKREVLGDILMQGASAQVLVESKMVEWIKQNFIKAAMVPVTVEEISFEDLSLPKQTPKEIKATVASLRLDAVGAAGFGVSRSKMVSAISGDKVQINWGPVKGPAQTVNPGDIISFRGRGRIEIIELTGKSRKGRTGVCIHRYR
ncbi:MAG: RNA-binding protein [Dialister pneumosintes]